MGTQAEETLKEECANAEITAPTYLKGTKLINKRFLPGALKAQRLRFRMVVETLFECLSCGSQAGEMLRLKGFKCSGL